MRFWGGRSTVVFGFLALVTGALATSALAAPFSAPPPSVKVATPIIPVVVFGRNARRLPKDFAAEHNLDAAELIRGHAASGLIQCGNAHGAGQLTLTDDVVTTAAHVLFDENGMPRSSSCTFAVAFEGHELRVPLDMASIVPGSSNPYNVAPADDWAVARLVRPMTGVRPYGLASNIHENAPITFISRGHIDWGEAKRMSMQECLMHDQLSIGTHQTREFSFDCDTGDGASGGALMFDSAYTRIGAILVGWRSNRPFTGQPFARTHYNFAVTIEGGFRRAVYAAAGKVISQK